MSKLLNRPYPKENETLDGYICRLAAHNYMTKSDLLAGLKLPYKAKSFKISDRNSIVSVLSAATGLSFVDKLFDKRRHHNKYKHLFEYQSQKFCKECMISSNYVRSFWDFENYAVCHYHGLPLIVSCICCSNALSTECVVNRSCRYCGELILPSDSAKCEIDPVSARIGKAISQPLNDIENALSLISHELNDIEPYFRLLLGGKFKPANELRKKSAGEFARLQGKAHSLKLDDSSSIELLAQHLSGVASSKGLPSALSKFKDVIDNSEDYKFSTVIKQVLVSGQATLSNKYVMTALVAKLWKVDEGKLIEVLNSIDPQILKGGKRIYLADFSNFSSEIFLRIRGN